MIFIKNIITPYCLLSTAYCLLLRSRIPYLTIDYRFPGKWAQGLWIRLRGSIVDRQGEDEIRQLRVIVNYDIPVF